MNRLAPSRMLPRALALVLDTLMVSLIFSAIEIVLMAVGAWRGERLNLQPAPVGIGYGQGVLYGLVNLVYFARYWTLGGSPGQRALRMYTLKASDGSLLTWNQALLRWLYLYGPVALVNVVPRTSTVGERTFVSTTYIAAVLCGYAYWAFLVWTAARDPKRQGFHDVQAHTVVAKVLPPHDLKLQT